jgi:uncharacterized protein YbaR (Trm112 family)
MIVITCPRCKHVFEIATPPISGTVACPSCNKGLRLRPKTSADVLPALERRPAKSSRRAMMVGLGFLVLVVGVGIAYKLRPKRVPTGAATKPASTTTGPAARPATTGPTTKPIPRRPRGVPPGYQIGPD